MKFRWLILLLLVGMILAGCTLPEETTTDPTAVQEMLNTLSAATDTPKAAPEALATAPLVPEPAITPAYYVFPPFGIAGTTAWIVEAGEPTRLTLPDLAYNQYDHSPVTGKLLHPSRFPDHGAGPANLSVGDLWIYDIVSQTDEMIFQEENIVEAMWAPDGQGFVYLKATETNYELRFHNLSGEDWLIVEGAAPVFSLSPDGQQVGFTRETGYQVGDPGLYVIPVTGGEARKVSSVDRQGAGSVADFPLWSQDSRFILLPVSYIYDSPRWFLIATDGSLEKQLTFGPGVPEAFQRQDFNPGIWLPDGSGFVGTQSQGMMDPPYAQEVAVAELDLETAEITRVTPVDYGALFPAAWETPGERLWMIDEDGKLSLLDLRAPTPLPQTCKASDANTFVNPFKGYCFSYPQDFTIQAYEYEHPLFLGPVVDESIEPPQASFWVETETAVEETNLNVAVDAFIAAQPASEAAITRTPASLGGVPAEVLDNVPGQLASRVVIALKDGMIYRLWFNPTDENRPQLQSDLERAFTTVIASYGWLPK
jgi:hypothetical protein